MRVGGWRRKGGPMKDTHSPMQLQNNASGSQDFKSKQIEVNSQARDLCYILCVKNQIH